VSQTRRIAKIRVAMCLRLVELRHHHVGHEEVERDERKHLPKSRTAELGGAAKQG
jgi:hypothetical protein